MHVGSKAQEPRAPPPKHFVACLWTHIYICETEEALEKNSERERERERERTNERERDRERETASYLCLDGSLYGLMGCLDDLCLHTLQPKSSHLFPECNYSCSFAFVLFVCFWQPPTCCSMISQYQNILSHVGCSGRVILIYFNIYTYIYIYPPASEMRG